MKSIGQNNFPQAESFSLSLQVKSSGAKICKSRYANGVFRLYSVFISCQGGEARYDKMFKAITAPISLVDRAHIVGDDFKRGIRIKTKTYTPAATPFPSQINAFKL